MLLYDIKVIVEMWAFIEFFSYDLLYRNCQMYQLLKQFIHYILLTQWNVYMQSEINSSKENHIKAVPNTLSHIFTSFLSL